MGMCQGAITQHRRAGPQGTRAPLLHLSPKQQVWQPGAPQDGGVCGRPLPLLHELQHRHCCRRLALHPGGPTAPAHGRLDVWRRDQFPAPRRHHRRLGQHRCQRLRSQVGAALRGIALHHRRRDHECRAERRGAARGPRRGGVGCRHVFCGCERLHLRNLPCRLPGSAERLGACFWHLRGPALASDLLRPGFRVSRWGMEVAARPGGGALAGGHPLAGPACGEPALASPEGPQRAGHRGDGNPVSERTGGRRERGDRHHRGRHQCQQGGRPVVARGDLLQALMAGDPRDRHQCLATGDWHQRGHLLRSHGLGGARPQ
mmetsp:Transcript_99739/g.316584  ORF Transcript_99739/g.316584 Transcript_99739/m.316584 type:complete len:317 (-) Transcript_99739:636-1586(-)